MCQQRTVGDEKHLVFECPALHDLRDHGMTSLICSSLRVRRQMLWYCSCCKML